ncbi:MULTISPECIES: PTS sugar transporter subunit IIA [unclassified Xanthobacter]|uniref:PTS sugar transporter subunit IIA n=1 Tax=unclassified Xanthobacter TaxID=2623496 RepID=UPI001F44A18A|nr:MULTISPECIES: PTS sugar transporter subunit IIA [unclassified Xanthobacter]
MKISDFLQPENVFIDLPSTSKADVLKRLSDAASRQLGIDGSVIFDTLHSRERLGSTGVGGGIAIPHARVPNLKRPFGMLARLASDVAFEAIDDIPVDIVFVLLMPDDSTKAHLNMLACIARRLRTAEVLKEVRAARDSDQLYAAVVDRPETKLPIE